MIDTLLAGGAERLAVELACGLDRARFAPHVLVTRYTGPLESLLQAAEVPYTVLGRTRRLQLGAWVTAHRLARKTDLIHAHKFGSNIWGALLARTARKPFIAHEHNFAAEASRVRTLLDRRWIAPRAERIVCVSESVAAVERSIGIPEHVLTVVPNGVRLEAAWPRAAAREELGLDQNDFVIGIVGRLRPEKAHEVAFRALASLVAAGRSVRLCVVGDGPRLAELRALAAELGIEAHVTWAGERQDAARLAGAFDVSTICSHWEGLPLAALEALAAGSPLAATAVGGLPDLLAGGAGLLVPAGDAEALATAIARCQDDTGLARELGLAGQRRVREHYGFRRMVHRVEELYTETLLRTVGAPPLLEDTNHQSKHTGQGEAA